MRIGIVGCGALGSYYGAKLLHGGHEVHFLLRSDYEIVREKGLWVRSPQGDFHVHPQCAKEPESIGACELVIVGLKTTANDQLQPLVGPLVDPNTLILTLQNGLGNEARLAESFEADRILGGLCFVCLNRLRPGLVHHIDHGQIVIGEYLRPPEQRTKALGEMFQASGISCEIAENLERAHWEKLIWNIPFNGLGVASAAGFEAVDRGFSEPNKDLQACLATDKLLGSPEWEGLVRELMQEVILAARKLGHDIPFEMADILVAKTRTMGTYRPSTLIDFERGQPLEMENLFLEPLRQARAAGAATPRLEKLCAVLNELDK